MADVDTIESAICATRRVLQRSTQQRNALAAQKAGADLVGTTLYGYTAQTKHLSPPGFDLLSQIVEQLDIPVICEGGIASPQMAQEAMKLGAYAVVVGTAITGIDLQVKAYQEAILIASDTH
jgi:N-acylglucosamine-6-phosphate 2-epimerase